MNVLTNYAILNKTSNSVTQTLTPKVKMPEYKPDILDIFSEKVVNKRDLTDMVTVPRSIFKGYLCFTTGTAVNGIAGMLKSKPVVSKTLAVLGSFLSIYGTYNFVKPFLIKE